MLHSKKKALIRCQNDSNNANCILRQLAKPVFFQGILIVTTVTITFDTRSEPHSLPTLSSSIPLEITVSKEPNPPTLTSLQHDFDVFSWKSFIALNWPANSDGSASSDSVIGNNLSGSVVWENWRESRSIFLPDGKTPAPWGQGESIPDVCKQIKDVPEGVLFLTQVGKTPNVLDESGQPFQTGPLIDQNGQYTRFEILTNESMFNYILDHKLYSKVGQAAFNQNANFPASDVSSQKVGAIMLKASWIKMGGKFKPSDFYTSDALVYDNPDEQYGIKPACSLEKVGLVGFHIAHKTEGEPQWVWSTFEHIANAPTKEEKPELAAYNFYDASCQDCKINTPPPRPWNPAIPHTAPTQVERIIPITKSTKELNERYQKALREAVPNSVWANYQLISTQWPTDVSSVSDPTGVPAPSFLANTTLETYIQGEIKQTSSSCIACHNNATGTNGNFSDFTYLLQRAQ